MSEKVIVYSSTGCPRCLQVKEQLKEWGVEYEERNISEVREYFDELQARKIFGTPATFVNNKPILGFQPEKLKLALGIDDDAAAQSKAQEEPKPAAASNAAGQAAESAGQASNIGDIFRPADAAVFAETYDFVSIGGGPAGASAAVYAARARMKTLVVDKAPAAGTLAITHKIANYPGVRQEVTGLGLLKEMLLHAKDFGAEFVRAQVTGVDFSDPEIKLIHTGEGTIKAKSVFIAVGAKAPSSKIEGEETFTGRGVSYCSTCDAAFFENRTVVVVGENEEAIHEAGQLAKFCKEVRLLIPSAKLKGEVDLSELEAMPNVQIYYRHRLKSIQGEHAVDKVVIQDDQRAEHTWEIDGVFLYLAGMKPGTDFLGNAVSRDEEGYVNVDSNMQTSVEGVFAGGDARRTPVKQAVISASDGCIAALAAEKFVNKRSAVRPQYA